MSRDDLPYSDIVSFLKENNNFIILTHDKPDGDTVGSAYALTYLLREIGKKAGILNNPKAGAKLLPYFEDAVIDFSLDDVTVVSVDVADEKLLFDDASIFLRFLCRNLRSIFCRRCNRLHNCQ